MSAVISWDHELLFIFPSYDWVRKVLLFLEPGCPFDEGASTCFEFFSEGNGFELFSKNFKKRVAWPMHGYWSLFYCFASFI